MSCRISLDMQVGNCRLLGGPPIEDAYRLYVNDEQWTMYNPTDPVDLRNLLPSYDLAHGDCVLSGLGLGLLPNMLARKQNVKSIKVYEINKDVIEFNKEIRNLDDRIEIINDSIHNYKGQTADCVLLDHYEYEPDHLVIEDVRKIATQNKQGLIWWWKAEAHIMAAIVRKYRRNRDLDEVKMYQHYMDWREEAKIPNLPLYEEETLFSYLQLCNVYSRGS
jgi:hypothetical protein